MSKLKNSIKNDIRRAIHSYIVSPIVTKMAQQIDLVVLNNLTFLGILIAAFVFLSYLRKTAGLLPMFYF